MSKKDKKICKGEKDDRAKIEEGERHLLHLHLKKNAVVQNRMNHKGRLKVQNTHPRKRKVIAYLKA